MHSIRLHLPQSLQPRLPWSDRTCFSRRFTNGVSGSMDANTQSWSQQLRQNQEQLPIAQPLPRFRPNLEGLAQRKHGYGKRQKQPMQAQTERTARSPNRLPDASKTEERPSLGKFPMQHVQYQSPKTALRRGIETDSQAACLRVNLQLDDFQHSKAR